jgi:hypothetical protein
MSNPAEGAPDYTIHLGDDHRGFEVRPPLEEVAATGLASALSEKLSREVNVTRQDGNGTAYWIGQGNEIRSPDKKPSLDHLGKYVSDALDPASMLEIATEDKRAALLRRAS